MSEAYSTGCAGSAIRSEGGHRARLRATDGLGLAAAPAFATLALFTGLSGGEAMCSAAQASPLGGSALGGMAVMYGLMAVFHLPAWLKLISRGEEA
jgi:hypothetical protein